MSFLEHTIQYFVRRHILTNLMFLLVFIGGIFSWKNIQREEMPDVTFDFVRISLSYPGATAEEVEHFVTIPIEKQLSGLDGVYRMNSSSTDGSCSIFVELESDYSNKDEAIMDIRNAVMDTRFPDDVTDDPRIRVFKTSRKAIIDIALIDTSVHLLDVKTRKRLQEYALALENQLLGLQEVSAVNRSGYFQEEIQIIADPLKLLRYDLPFNSVMNEIKSNHVRKPAGNIEAKKEPKVTLLSELDTVEKLKALIVQGGFEGKVLRLEQVADIKYGYNRNKEITKINGHEGIVLNIVKSSSNGILESLDAVMRKVDMFRKNNLASTTIQVVTLDDESIDLRNRLSLITINGIIGFVLILILLFVFLNFESGIWVAMGIPFTIFFTLFFSYMLGFTINNITLAAVIIVMGMIVDDAIVVSENVTRLRREGFDRESAAVKGTAFVFSPIVASVLTTCLAFIPLFFFKARFGRILKYIPPVIFIMLGASLFESLLILPGHLNLRFPRIFGSDKKEVQKVHWFDKYEDRYAAFLKFILPFKWILFIAFGFLLLFSGSVLKNKMKFVMFPREETREITLNGEAEADIDRFETAGLTKKIEKVIEPYLGKEVIGWRTQIARGRRGSAVRENKFRISVEIVPKEKRNISADALIAKWQPSFDAIKGLKELKAAKSRWGQDSGSPIEVVIRDNNDKTRKDAALTILKDLKEHPALINAEIEEPLTNPEYRISLNREKIKRLSINPADVSTTFRAALEGIVLYELTQGNDEIDVRFTVNDRSKSSIEKILQIPIENRGDYLVPLKDIVNLEKTATPSSIERKEGKRITKVFADIKKQSKITPLEIADYFEQEKFPEVTAKFPTSVIEFEGEIKDTREAGSELKNAVLMVLFLIYLILVLLFSSFIRPLIIMLAIPFGIVGIILAFMLHGKIVYGFFAVIGALGLAGVVVNDSIIMLVKLTRNFDTGLPHSSSIEQVSEIAKTRLRAVLLTTLTTVAGLFPTAYGFAGYDAMLADMMLALTWGLIFGTFITLLLIPSVYSLMLDIRYLVNSRLLKGKNT